MNSWKSRLLLAESFSDQEWLKLFRNTLEGRLNSQETKALLLLLARKGEEVSELWGCLNVVRRLEPPKPVSLPFLIDVCGTGGDGQGAFNISTVSAFVIAGAGGYVAKHGNRSVSSKVGSSDLMEALGVRLDLPFGQMLNALQEYHLGYFHAPLYHASFSGVQTVRREIGIRTLFNLLGPLVNPVEVTYQMIGISNPDWMEPIGEALRKVGRKRAAVFYSRDGFDELSTGAENVILYLAEGKQRKFHLDPQKWGFSKASLRDYQGGGLQTHRRIGLGILENRLKGPCQDVVVLNSGFALWLSGLAKSLTEGIEKSRWVIRTGQAREVLGALQRLSRSKVYGRKS